MNALGDWRGEIAKAFQAQPHPVVGVFREEEQKNHYHYPDGPIAKLSPMIVSLINEGNNVKVRIVGDANQGQYHFIVNITAGGMGHVGSDTINYIPSNPHIMGWPQRIVHTVYKHIDDELEFAETMGIDPLTRGNTDELAT